MMAGPFSLRTLSRSIPRRALSTYRQTINYSKTVIKNNKNNSNSNNNSDNGTSYVMTICIILMMISMAFNFQTQSIARTTGRDKVAISGNTLVNGSSSITRGGEVSTKQVIGIQQKDTYHYTSNVTITASTRGTLLVIQNESTTINYYSNDRDKVHYLTKVDEFINKEEPLNFNALFKVSFLCFSSIIFIVILHIKRTLCEQVCLASPQTVTWALLIFRLLPLKTLSRINGRLTTIKHPIFFRYILWSIFIKLFRVDMSEALDERLSSYECFQDLFKRKLKPGLRPICKSANIVSPVDGTVMYIGPVTNNCVEQVKGVTYSLSAFLGRGLFEEQHTNLYSIALYLSPGDYHRFHSPTDWSVNLFRHFPGELVTVSPWAVRNMPGLFALNERVLLSGEWEHGYFSLTAVGAFNVGSIYLDSYEELQTNIKGHYKFNTYTDKHSSHSYHKGQHLGGFNIGSTVVLIFEAPPTFKFSVEVGQRVKYGIPLAVS